MKILHVIPSVALVRGGPSQAVLEMVASLRSQGVEAEIATTNDNGPELLPVPLGQQVDYCQVPVYFFPRFSPGSAAVREFAFSAALTRWLWQHSGEYDLLHIHAIFSYPSTTAMAIARLQRIPYIVRPLGQLCQWSLQQSRQKKQAYLGLIERANLNGSCALHCTSVQEQQEAAGLGLRSPRVVIPHGLTPPIPVKDARDRLCKWLNLPPEPPMILFLSRLHAKKGLDLLIPALGKLKHLPFSFILAGSGSGEYEAEIDQLLLVNGIHDRTYRSGFVQGEMKEVLLQGCDLFALTSHSENFGVVVLEAMAAGLPVVVTPGVALASVVQEYSVGYVPDLTINAIASALNHALTHPEGLQAMGDRARYMIQKQYTWQKTSANLLQLYTECISRVPLLL
jgi:glycosyltransferase involved in cell wall biosynthesis